MPGCEDLGRLVFDSAEQEMAVVGADGRILEVNAAWRRFGAANGGGEGCGVGADYLAVCGQAAEVAEGIRGVQEGRLERYEGEYECSREGERRWFVMRVVRLEGRPGTVVVTHTEVTAQRRAEERLRASQERFLLLFETMSQGVVYQSEDGRIVAANPAAERILGLTLDQMLGRTSLDPGWRTLREDGGVLGGADHPSMVALRTGVATKGSLMGVYQPLRGEHRWLAVDATPLFRPGQEKPYQVYTTFEDVTERRQHAELLRASETRFRRLFEAMTTGFALQEVVRDAEGRVEDFRVVALNPAFERMTGSRAETMVGRTLREMLGERAEVWIERYRQVEESGLPWHAVEDVRPGAVWFEMTAFRPAEGQVACLIEDVTEQRRLTEMLVESQKMETVGRLAGGVAHDFNNLLTVINGYSQLLLGRGGLAEGQRLGLEEIRKAGERAAELTSQLLAFSRKQVQHVERLDLAEVVTGLLPMLARMVGERVEVRLEAEPRAWVDADRHQLEQVLLHLVANAREAMPGGGRVTLRVRRRVEEVELSVTDTGQGMDEETKARMFEPFFTTKGVGAGTGLGLSMVQGIVLQSGGRMEVESEVGRGTAMRILLPSDGRGAASGVGG